mmetsp:Transcript_11710/g.33061  ORF Transcript_11710/g.33061 Transcript_11710/m.33061 type:complete len:256 (+) Transcript_11710:2298-3065(+)
MLGSEAARAASGRPPIIRWRPVAATGSQYLPTHRTMRVPVAMLCAAKNMNASPLMVRAPWTSGAAAVTAVAVLSMMPPPTLCPSRSTRPDTPRTSPTIPPSPRVSPNRILDASATESGCESMITDPSPADVRCRPSARNPWKHAPSTSPNSATASHPTADDGPFSPFALAHRRSRPPAGRHRHAAMNIGGMPSVFMATIDVPQKKNGLMRSAASTACDSAVELDVLVDASAAAAAVEPAERSYSGTVHSTSIPVP